ncbi:MAG: hypothetical protein ACOYL8_03965 [Patescibacteria group bacterium]
MKTKTRRVIAGLSLFGSLLISYYLVLMFSVTKAEIALAELNKSFQEELVCHEECYVLRQTKEKIVVADLKNNSKKLLKLINNYWLDEKTSLEFKKELIRIYFLAYGADKAPDIIKEYLSLENPNQELLSEILVTFNLDLVSSEKLSVSLDNKMVSAATSSEKIVILKTLAKLDSDILIDKYISLLSSGESLELKREAVKNISAIREKSTYFSLEQLNIIKALIMSSGIELSLRRDLVLLVGDYFLVYPLESAELWREIYKNESLDSISRLFSADNLNHLSDDKLILPEVSASEWDEYYNK